MSVQEDIRNLREWLTPTTSMGATVSQRMALEALDRIEAELLKKQKQCQHQVNHEVPRHFICDLCGATSVFGSNEWKHK